MLGAEPTLIFLDTYYATGEIKIPKSPLMWFEGIAEGCPPVKTQQLIGGETAENAWQCITKVIMDLAGFLRWRG